ncbi:MAG: hypothetical protein IJ946_01700 [Clostridia bacterium]|nr:hypothetical protein [Clostridia bacterium]
MKHLTVDEIIAFVSFEEENESTVRLASKVNGHICSCSQCFEKVCAFQTVYDELTKIGREANLQKFVYKIIDDEKLQEINANELEAEMRLISEDGKLSR